MKKDEQTTGIQTSDEIKEILLSVKTGAMSVKTAEKLISKLFSKVPERVVIREVSSDGCQY